MPADLNRAPLGVTLIDDGGTFRVWAPEALAVAVRGTFTGWDDVALAQQAGGYWAAFVSGVSDGDEYIFFVTGKGGVGEKRDPYARMLTDAPEWPHSNCTVVNPDVFPWHDASFRTPRFNDIVLYQLHVGAFYSVDEQGDDRRAARPGRFLDLLAKIEYLAALGVNAVQLLPIQEFASERSLGYNGTDYFSPEMDYAVQTSEPEFDDYLARANALLAANGHTPYTAADLSTDVGQLRAVIDIFHVYGIAVILDVVYNHAGGDFGDESIYFFDRQVPGDFNRSLYFTDQGWAGGLVFAFWKHEVRQFLIDNAISFLREYHVDGFRLDEVTVIDRNGGWPFVQDLTDAVHAAKPDALVIAEYWAEQSAVVRPRRDGGAGCDAVVAAELRAAVRETITAAAHGAETPLDLQRLADALIPPHAEAWRAVQHLENQDVVRVNNTTDRQPRIPAVADPSNPRSWYARSRSRVANGLLLTSAGIPMLFMGQEMLEDKYWSDNPGYFDDTLIWWDGLSSDAAMRDHLRFVRDLLTVRARLDALRGDRIHTFHAHSRNRVLACHRWIDGNGADVVMVASLREHTWWAYQLGFPRAGQWREVFNSDLYDHFPNSQVAGNGGHIVADGPPRDGMPASAAIIIPANGILIFECARFA